MSDQEVFKKHFSHVDIERNVDSIKVVIYFKGVDRPYGMGWSMVGHKHEPLAMRLKRALESGNALRNYSVKKDINGQTYLSFETNVYGRHMNADLKKLGY